MTEGFLGRWARRKQDAREGRPLEEAAVDPSAAPVSPVPVQVPVPATPAPTAAAGVVDETPGEPAALPTLDDARQLTPQSDFKPFVARDVAPEVRNAAMKKLFADPHFNVMDGLDIYIDDYSKPDPLPAPMLRKMASAQFLNLFDDDKNKDIATRSTASPEAAPAKAESAAALPEPASEAPLNTQDNHADPDLRLQQNHAAGAQGSGSGA